MNGLTPLDGGIIGVYLLATMVVGIAIRKYVGRVEDFLVARRQMDVYLGIASLAATEFGIVSCMYASQNGYEKGFAGAIPGVLTFAAMFLVGWTGFCIKPLRDSGVMTIPELFEKKFGSRVRWAAGVVIVLGGLLNMGVFLRVGGDFLIHACGMDPGHHKLEIMMTALLVGVAVYTILGGMLSVLVTDFLQFIMMSAGLIVVTFLILHKIGWTGLVSTVQTYHGAGGFNPFKNPSIGWSYVIFNALLNTAAVLTWQTQIARVLSAKDSGTGRKVYTRTSFFFVARFLIPGIWGIAALATIGWVPLKTLSSDQLATIPLAIQQKIEASKISKVFAATDDDYAKLSPADQAGTLSPAETAAIPREVVARLKEASLHHMPLFLGMFVPAGLMGLLIAAMLAADMSTDSSYMLTWGGVIYNDILAPFRKRKWSEKKGLLWNRAIIALIGVFLLIYGLWYKLEGDLWTYLGITGTIYLSSMSVLLIACCYWRRANSWGAAAAIVCGAAVPVSTLVLQKYGPWTQWITDHNTTCGIAAYEQVALAMIIGSLLKPQPPAAAEGVKA
ncbi:MAG: sodium:solute symporter family protein [Phycisphaerae bacterium]|nr:sodium:solute symporter family protein [Phycisphaerae bacterium]